MSCHGGSCSCGKGSQSSVQENPTLVQMSTSRGVLSTHDFMKGLGSLTVDEEVVEIRFKNNRKAYFRNTRGNIMQKDERVVVEVDGGHDLGTVSLTGDLAQRRFDQNSPDTIKSSLKKIYRKATQADLKKWLDAKKRERDVLLQARHLAAELQLDMGISDVEIQGDGKKITIFYTAASQVDFRELARKYESVFRDKHFQRGAGIQFQYSA